MKLSKAQRSELRMKYDGLCAYCGGPLPERWHADHHHAVVRLGSVIERPHHDIIDNLMPSCPPCNISKSRLSIEQWRDWLAGHLRSLNEHHSIYRLMKAYGLVVETGKPIVFHFERLRVAGEIRGMGC